MDEEKNVKLVKLRNDILICKKCTVRMEARCPVPWEINNIVSPVLLMGRNPGIDEDMGGRPFIGRGGHVLDVNLARNLIARDTINIGNTIQCYTTKDRVPLWSEVRECFQFVLRYLDMLQPKLVVLFGSLTIEAFTNLETVKDAEFKLFDHKRGFQMVCSPHPGSVLRGGSKLRFMKSFDFCMEHVNRVLNAES